MKRYEMNQPLKPDEEQFLILARRAFNSRWLTNFGQLHEEFEAALETYLGCQHVLPVTNATFGLLTVLKALNVQGEVITTPFTFPATPHVLFSISGIRPVFVDVSPHDFCLSPKSVKQAITPETSAILAVHAYGYPCRVKELEKIAREHGLRLIFDAAPSFGVRYGGRSIADYGDVSVFSFHATKVFTTAEGGAIVCRDEETYRWCRLFINFGISGENSVELPGLNGKLDELRSALGLVGLGRIQWAIDRRRQVVERYLSFFRKSGFKNVSVNYAVYDDEQNQLNYAYFPVLIQPHGRLTRDRLYEKLRTCRVIVRKYYYPTVLDLPVYESLDKRTEDVSCAAALSKNILCLPVSPNFNEADCDYVIWQFERCLRQLQGGAR